MDTLHDQICALVKISLEDKQYSDFISFPISAHTITKIKKKIYVNLENYTCVIHSDEIRHIKKEHGDEVMHICEIPRYLEKFAKIEKSTTRDKPTGKNIPCFVFTKRNSNIDVKIVKMNISKDKILRLKTMYEA
ncbi:hypothetical protein [Sulfurimonas sp.]|uniref:PBECR3 domain-containing polyvalent protein n=1 Tax=Sulfurimonas sp. TaxID=2022749 RepID=UPI003D0B79AF